jgi:hypothetical protein
MRGFIAVVEREIYERRLLGVVALVLGVTAVVLPVVPGFRPGGVSVEDLRNSMALGFALLLTFLMAVFLGGSIIASDLAERRLGFYFARPLSGRVIWGGKVASALVLMLGAGFLVLAPTALVGGGFNLDSLWIEGLSTLSGPVFLQLTPLFLLFLFLAAHVTSIVVRARSAWILLDILALGLVVGLVEGSTRRLIHAGVLPVRLTWTRSGRSGFVQEIGVTAWIALAVAVATLLALILSGAFQVARGRTDLRRGHRVLSSTLWGILLATALLVAGFTSWVLAAGPEDLTSVESLTASPSGHWLALLGPAARRPGYHPGFFYNLDSGRSVHARFSGRTDTIYASPELSLRFSADGKRAVWLEYDGAPYQSPLVLYGMDLDRPEARPVRSTVSFPYQPYAMALSPDGRRLAAYAADRRDYSGRLIVQETESGRLLASLRYDKGGAFPRLTFTRSGRLRIYESSPYGRPGFSEEEKETPLNISEVDLASASPRIEPTGRLPVVHGLPGWSLNLATDRLLLRGKEGVRLCDGSTGEVLAQLGASRAFAYFLADGRIAVLDRPRPGSPALRILSPDGRAELRRFDFPGALAVVPGDQPSPGSLRVVVSGRSPRPQWDLRLLDFESGASRSLGPRRLVVPHNYPATGPGDERLAVALEKADGVLWFDFASFQERVLLKGS